MYADIIRGEYLSIHEFQQLLPLSVPLPLHWRHHTPQQTMDPFWSSCQMQARCQPMLYRYTQRDQARTDRFSCFIWPARSCMFTLLDAKPCTQATLLRNTGPACETSCKEIARSLSTHIVALPAMTDGPGDVEVSVKQHRRHSRPQCPRRQQALRAATCRKVACSHRHTSVTSFM